MTPVCQKYALYLILLLSSCLPLHAGDKAAAAAWKKDTQQARKALEKNQFAEAGRLFEAALVEAEKLDPDDSRLAETLRYLARVRMQLGECPGAETALRRALTMDEKRFGTNDIALSGDYLELGRLCVYANRCAEGDIYFLRAQTLLQRKFGRYDRTAGLCILGRANAAMVDDRLEESEKLFKEGLDLIQSERHAVRVKPNEVITRYVQLPSKTDLADALNNLGLLYTKEKKFADAETALNQSLKTYEYEYGKDSLHLCNGLLNLADVEAQEGRLSDAEALLRRSLVILKGTDANHPVAIKTRNLLDEIIKASRNAPKS